MNRNLKIYAHLLVSFLLIPAFLYGGSAIKAILLIYAVWLVLKKDAAYLPSLIVQASYMTNSYALYFAMMVLVIKNYKEIKSHGLQRLLIIILFLLPVVIYYFSLNYFVLGQKAGLALNQFQFYFALFAFFFGILISSTFDNNVIKALIKTLFLLYFLNLLTEQLSATTTIRLVFFIIPFFVSFFVYLIFFERKRYAIGYFLLTLFTLLLTFNVKDMTFTIILLIVYSSFIVYSYFNGKTNIIRRITGILFIAVLFFSVGLAIANSNKHNIYNTKLMNIEDSGSFQKFSMRFQFKFFKDRGLLWASTWDQVTHNRNWMPPLKIKKIKLELGGEEPREFDFHSHNVFLELLRSNGIIMGLILALALIRIILLGRRIFLVSDVNPYLIVLVSVAISGLLLGSMTGIYPLLSSFAVCGLSITGIAFSEYFRLTSGAPTSRVLL